MTAAPENNNTNESNVVQGVKFKEHPVQNYSSVNTVKFLDTVFHGLQEGEHIGTFYSKKGQPSYPEPASKAINKIDRVSIPYAFYFGTSSLLPEKNTGKIYNRKAQFAALHVVVLDDIGTKINADDLPEDLIPNYIIESSEGNYQYGFILEEPIRDVALADALVHLVYTSGYSDEGGKIVTKAVRLPAGVNCKVGTEKFLDPVKLIELNDEFWTPEDLVATLDMGVTWEQVLADPNHISKQKTQALRSLSPWAAVPIIAQANSGIVDSMLEYLYSEDMVKHDTGVDWVVIECPWKDQHTTGEDTAGYSPLGRGGIEYENQRGFKCLHGHCASQSTQTFLHEMAMQGSEELPVYDTAAYLTRDYVYDQSTDCAVRVANCKTPYAVPMKGFRNANNLKTTIYKSDGKTQRVPMSSIWETARHRVVVAGNSYNPINPAIIDTDEYGVNRLNMFVEPPWGDGDYIQSDVDRFISIAKFLIPIEEEYDYFMQWLAAKVQNRDFKGNAILMVATTQGIGRTMFTDLITDMFTHDNCGKVTFPEMIASGGFNEWASNILVFCDEVMTDKNKLYKSYETMKDLLDPRPKMVTINKKFGSKSAELNYASYMMLTNHESAIGALNNDRRIYVITNPNVRQEPEYYSEIEAWRNIKDDKGVPKWIASVWRWLRVQPFDLTMLSKPVPKTKAKRIMAEETEGAEDRLIAWCFENIAPCLPSKYIRELLHEVCDFIRQPYEVLPHIKPAIKDLTLNASKFKDVQRVGGKPVKFRIGKEQVTNGEIPSMIDDPNGVDRVIKESAGIVSRLEDSKEKKSLVLMTLGNILEEML